LAVGFITEDYGYGVNGSNFVNGKTVFCVIFAIWIDEHVLLLLLLRHADKTVRSPAKAAATTITHTPLHLEAVSDQLETPF
jgi:hypothetical protein